MHLKNYDGQNFNGHLQNFGGHLQIYDGHLQIYDGHLQIYDGHLQDAGNAQICASLPQKSSFLRVKISILKYQNHTRNHVKLTYLKSRQKINCLKRPKFREKNDLI
jgi:hypothetical protein